MPLTDVAIKALKPKDKPYRVYDGGGLYLEISLTGARLWRLKYRFQGKEKRLALGIYPDTPIRVARALMLEAKERLAVGEDPSKAKKEENTAANIFSAVAQEWLSIRGKEWSDSHRKTVVARLDMYILPEFGKTPIIEITPPQVLKFLRGIEASGKIETSYRVQGIISLVMRYGVGCGYCQTDPCRDLRGVLTSRSAVPQAALTTPEEAGALMAAIVDYPGYAAMRAALLWSAYTFCRPGEVRHAEWSEIDWERKEWRIPAEKMKMKREHRVPLCRQCMDLLELLKYPKFSEQWVFACYKSNRPMSENGVLSALRRLGYTQTQMCAHGFRAMASTLLNELGFRPDLIERQLAHGDRDKIRAVYNRAAYMEERRDMMQQWADYLDGLRRKHLQKFK